MDENQRSHVIEELAKALGHMSKARDWLDDETTPLGKLVNNYYEDIAETLDRLRKETI